MVDPQNFIDRLLESENLTDYLEDEDAQYLIDWGVARLKEGLQNMEDPQAAGDYSTRLMGFLRTLNQLAGNLADLEPDGLTQLVERYQAAFAKPSAMDPAGYPKVIASLVEMPPRQAIEYLLTWLESSQDSSQEGGLTLVED